MYRTKEKVSPCSTRPLTVRGQVATSLCIHTNTHGTHQTHVSRNPPDNHTHPTRRVCATHTAPVNTHMRRDPTLPSLPSVLLHEQVRSFGSDSFCRSCESRSLWLIQARVRSRAALLTDVRSEDPPASVPVRGVGSRRAPAWAAAAVPTSERPLLLRAPELGLPVLRCNQF